MSKWNSAEWEALYSGGSLSDLPRWPPIWNSGKAKRDLPKLTSSPESPMRGYCCLVLKRHAVELHDLNAEEGAALMTDMQRVAEALQTITGAVKLNYEIHGNTIPHLHVHLLPRYKGDPFEQGRLIRGGLRDRLTRQESLRSSRSGYRRG